MDARTALTILGMALATYATRAGGFWLMSRVRVTPRLELVLRHIPGAVLVSIVAPMLATSGPADLIAAGVTVAAGVTTKSVLLAMVAGVVAVVIARAAM
jgi:uncharacterized membrane protein